MTLFILVIMLVCGFGLYAMLRPPAELYAEPERNELFADSPPSSLPLPEYSKVHILGKEE